MEEIAKGHQLFLQAFPGVMPVVEMDLHFAIAPSAELGELIQDIGIVILLGIKEGVFGVDSVGVAKGIDRSRIGRKPIPDNLTCHDGIAIIPERLKVVAHAKDQMPCA